MKFMKFPTIALASRLPGPLPPTPQTPPKSHTKHAFSPNATLLARAILQPPYAYDQPSGVGRGAIVENHAVVPLRRSFYVNVPGSPTCLIRLL